MGWQQTPVLVGAQCIAQGVRETGCQSCIGKHCHQPAGNTEGFCEGVVGQEQAFAVDTTIRCSDLPFLLTVAYLQRRRVFITDDRIRQGFEQYADKLRRLCEIAVWQYSPSWK